MPCSHDHADHQCQHDASKAKPFVRLRHPSMFVSSDSRSSSSQTDRPKKGMILYNGPMTRHAVNHDWVLGWRAQTGSTGASGMAFPVYRALGVFCSIQGNTVRPSRKLHQKDKHYTTGTCVSWYLVPIARVRPGVPGTRTLR